MFVKIQATALGTEEGGYSREARGEREKDREESGEEEVDEVDEVAEEEEGGDVGERWRRNTAGRRLLDEAICWRVLDRHGGEGRQDGRRRRGEAGRVEKGRGD